MQMQDVYLLNPNEAMIFPVIAEEFYLQFDVGIKGIYAASYEGHNPELGMSGNYLYGKQVTYEMDTERFIQGYRNTLIF